MLAERDYCARLRAFCALGMSRDETYLIANRELFERSVHDAVAMEIDLAAVGAQNEAAILRGQEPRDPSVVGHRVQLDVAPPLANVIFEHPASCVESVVDRDIDILMRMVRLGIAPDHDLVPWHFEIDPDPEQITLLTAGMLAFDNDAARYDPVKKAFELLGALTYSRRDGCAKQRSGRSRNCVLRCRRPSNATTTGREARLSTSNSNNATSRPLASCSGVPSKKASRCCAHLRDWPWAAAGRQGADAGNIRGAA